MALSLNLLRFLDIGAHLLTTAALSWLVYHVSGNAAFVWAVAAGGVLVDLDHFVDHFIFFGKKFLLSDFFGCNYLRGKKVYLFLHSWELAFALLVMGAVFGSRILLLVFCSLAIHLILDNLPKENPLFYILLYRKMKHFDASVLLPEFKGIYF